MKKLIILIIAVVFGNQMNGQTYNTFEPSKTQFMIRGYGHTGFEYMKSGDEKESTFLGSAFAPIFLFKHSDKLMFEAELEFVGSLDNKAVATNGNDFSSEIILSKAHMLKAHAMLDAEELLVSIPRRTCMTIISRDVDEETMNKFAYLHNFTWEDDSFGNAPITNSLFIVKEGTIVGHIPL